MKPIRKPLLMVLGATVVLGFLVCLIPEGDGEPIVQGEPISWWLTAGRNHTAEYRVAIDAMDETAVEYLIAKLAWRPPTLQIKLNRLLNPIFKRNIFSEERPDYREAAAATLGKMGIRARSAIPSLRRCATQSKTYARANYETAVQGAAMAALIQLQAESLDSCLEKLLQKGNTNWNACAMATLYLNTNAAAAVPALVKAFTMTNDEEIRGRIAGPLRFIRSNPELSVPALTTLLGHPNQSVRFQAAFGLYNFGAAAKPAWNSLTNVLSDPNRQVRDAARLALKRIDPETAKQLEPDESTEK